MSSLIIAALVLLHVTQLLQAAQCPSPFVLPITTTNLALGTQARGVPLKIGGQQFALRPFTAGSNINLVSNSTSCRGDKNVTSDLNCIAQFGGFFDPSLSKSWAPASDGVAAGGSSWLQSSNYFSSSDWGTDTLELGAGVQATKMPVGLNTDQVGGLGLSKHSSFIDTLIAQNLIASRTIGMDYGDAQTGNIDGSLVLGGYDIAKTQGDNLTLPIVNKPNCAELSLDISRLSLQRKDATDVDLLSFTGNSPLPGCLNTETPGLDAIILPESILKGANQSVDNNGTPNLDAILSITFTFANNWSVIIPHDQIAIKHRSPDERGRLISPSNPSLGLEDYPTDQNIAYLTSTFLQMVYLLIDHERDQFTMWNIKRPGVSNLVSLPATNATCQPGVGPDNTTGTGSGSSATDQSDSSKRNLGIGLGVGLAVLLLLVAAFFLWRRQQKQKQRSMSGSMYLTEFDEMNKSDSAPKRMDSLLWRKRPAVMIAEKSGESRERNELACEALLQERHTGGRGDETPELGGEMRASRAVTTGQHHPKEAKNGVYAVSPQTPDSTIQHHQPVELDGDR